MPSTPLTGRVNPATWPSPSFPKIQFQGERRVGDFRLLAVLHRVQNRTEIRAHVSASEEPAHCLGIVEARSGAQGDGGVASELLSFDLPVRHESCAGVVADVEMERRARDGLEQAGKGFGRDAGLKLEVDF